MFDWGRCLAVTAFAAFTAVPASAQDASRATPTNVRVAIVSRTVFYVPLWIAAQAGYFQKAGLKVDIEVFDNAEKIAEALRSVSVQIAISTPETVIIDALKGGDLRIIAGNAERLPHFVIAKPDIKSPSQLKGAVFGVLSVNEGTTYLVHEYARSIGLREGDYKVEQVGGAPTRWKLLREGKIDAGLQPFPLSYEAEAAGFTNLGPLAKVVPEWQLRPSTRAGDGLSETGQPLLRSWLRSSRAPIRCSPIAHWPLKSQHESCARRRSSQHGLWTTQIRYASCRKRSRQVRRV